MLPFLNRARRRRTASAAASLYEAVVGQARRPAFFADLGVPDTLDGRFEMIALHAFLVLHRLKGEGRAGAGLSQALFDLMFADMDVNLRELGVGDLGVGRRVKAMAQGFYGRVRAYEQGLAAPGEGALDDALARNLYGGADGASAERTARMAAYVRREARALAAQPLGALAAGRVAFGSPP